LLGDPDPPGLPWLGFILFLTTSAFIFPTLYAVCIIHVLPLLCRTEKNKSMVSSAIMAHGSMFGACDKKGNWILSLTKRACPGFSLEGRRKAQKKSAAASGALFFAVFPGKGPLGKPESGYSFLESISSWAAARKASRDMAPLSPSFRERTETVPSLSSFSPTTSM
jgi:hypothetical protein